jgi:phospholipase C
MSALDQIDTIVMVMLENRSFDHMLGNLSYGTMANGSGADGLTDPLARDAYVNPYQGERYYPHFMKDTALSTDLPHDRAAIATQMRMNAVTGAFAMDGFAKAYLDSSPTNRTATPDAMGCLAPTDVPMTRFLADNFAVCDRWFAALPAGTQPNRLMAWTGTSLIDGNGFLPLRDELLLDWMNRNGVRWRVYTSGISFFLLLGAKAAFGPNFRSIDRLAPDVAGEKEGDFPRVIIVEPAYGDAVRITGGVADDCHAPAAVGPAENLLRRIYEALTSNPARWARTMLIVYYDEHGGFYDHVAPPLIGYQPPPRAKWTTPFTSLGIRVPGLVVSPLVKPKQVYHDTLDHTSVLQLLAEKFTPGKPYSASVETRRTQGIHSVSAVLSPTIQQAKAPVAPNFSLQISVPLGNNGPASTPIEATFEQAAHDMVDKFPKETAQKYPAVSHWVLSQKQRPHG